MHLQQPNTYAGSTKLAIQQEFLLASELFVDDAFLIKKREHHITFLTSTAIILCLSLSAVPVLWSRRGTNSRSVQPIPAAITATTTPPLVDASRKKTTTGSPQKPSEHSRPNKSSTRKSIASRIPADNPVKRTPTNKSTRQTGSSVITKSPVPATGNKFRSVKKQPRQTPEKKPVFSPSNANNQLDRSAFYIPADTKNSVNRRRTSRRSSSRYSDNTTPSSSQTHNKVHIVANIAQLHGGQLKKTLEHNGDYYKIKLIIPEKQLLSFKKDLAKMVEYASYTNVPEESKPNTACLILETHFR